MKQKLIIMLLTACMALSCTFALAGCNDTPTADNGGTPYPDENASQGLEFALNDDSYWAPRHHRRDADGGGSRA